MLRQIFQAVLLTFFLEDLTSDFLHRCWRAAFCGYKICSKFSTVDILHRGWRAVFDVLKDMHTFCTDDILHRGWRAVFDVLNHQLKYIGKEAPPLDIINI